MNGRGSLPELRAFLDALEDIATESYWNDWDRLRIGYLIGRYVSIEMAVSNPRQAAKEISSAGNFIHPISSSGDAARPSSIAERLEKALSEFREEEIAPVAAQKEKVND